VGDIPWGCPFLISNNACTFHAPFFNLKKAESLRHYFTNGGIPKPNAMHAANNIHMDMFHKGYVIFIERSKINILKISTHKTPVIRSL
jgi:hypothetical protein